MMKKVSKKIIPKKFLLDKELDGVIGNVAAVGAGSARHGTGATCHSNTLALKGKCLHNP